MLQHIIASVILKLAYLATGVILCVIGKDLLEKGVTGSFKGEGEVASNKFRIVTSSPGLVFLVSGLAIVITAIIYQAKFTETGEVKSAFQQKQDSESLIELAKKTTVTSMLAEPSPQNQFMLSQYDAAEWFAKDNNVPVAVAYLVRAVVLQPQLLQRALESPYLKQTVRDPIFEAIIRERFKLPLEIAPVPVVVDQAILGQLRIYIAFSLQDKGKMEDVSSPLSKIPKQPKQEAKEVTLKNLQWVLSKNPQALLALLEDPTYRWILEDKIIVSSLRAKINELIEQTKTGSSSGGTK